MRTYILTLLGSGVVEGGYNVVNSGGTVTVGKHRNFPAKYLAISEIYVDMLAKNLIPLKGMGSMPSFTYFRVITPIKEISPLLPLSMTFIF